MKKEIIENRNRNLLEMFRRLLLAEVAFQRFLKNTKRESSASQISEIGSMRGARAFSTN